MKKERQLKIDPSAAQVKKRPWLIPALLLLSLALPLISLNIGFYGVSTRELLSLFLQGPDSVADNVAIIVYNIRIPRIIGAFAIGAGLAMGGGAYQSAFRNPLVSPNIIGVMHGAGFGAALALILRLNSLMVQLFAFTFGIAAVGIAYFIGSRARFDQDVSLVLAGSMISAFANALITALKYIADPNDTLPAITYWLMGSLAKVTMNGLIFSIVPIVIGCTVIFILRWRLNLLTLGDEEAQSMGIDPRRTRFLAIAAATVVSSAAMCLGGMIGWVGLMVPHLARGLAGADHRRMLPVAALMGGCFLLLMDNIARAALTMEIPIGVLTSLFGAPFFVMLLVRRRQA